MCTLEKRGNIFHLTLTGDGEHRLNLSLISSLLSALSEIKSQSTPGSVLITTAHGNKFFSNGFDLAWANTAAARNRLSQMVSAFKPVAAAGGLLLAFCHDYVTMRSDRGVLYMSEVDLGLPFPDYVTAAFRAKVGSKAALRDVLLKGRKVRGEEAVGMGIVDSAHDSAEKAVAMAMAMAEQLAKRNWKGDVYAEIRMGLYPELCEVLGLKPNVNITPKL